MVKVQIIDTELLDRAIERSGLKIGFICDELGISRQAFDKKRKGKNAFRKSEVYTLKGLLSIGSSDSDKIFLSK